MKLPRLIKQIGKRVVTYGSSHTADYRLEVVTLDGFSTRFHAFRHAYNALIEAVSDDSAQAIKGVQMILMRQAEAFIESHLRRRS